MLSSPHSEACGRPRQIVQVNTAPLTTRNGGDFTGAKRSPDEHMSRGLQVSVDDALGGRHCPEPHPRQYDAMRCDEEKGKRKKEREPVSLCAVPCVAHFFAQGEDVPSLRAWHTVTPSADQPHTNKGSRVLLSPLVWFPTAPQSVVTDTRVQAA